MNELLRVGYLLLPLLGGALLTGLASRFDWFAWLARPVDFGRRFRGRRLFGDNKKLRGVLTGGVGAAAVFAVQATVLHGVAGLKELEAFDYAAVSPWLFGFCLGAAAMLSELANSFAKRQLDIPPGRQAQGRWGPVFHVVDQVDLLLGAWLVIALAGALTLTRVLVSIVLVYVAHRLTTRIGFLLGLRRTAA